MSRISLDMNNLSFSDSVKKSKSSLMNINGSTADDSYRYKMPRIITKVESSGNGIKTLIVNMMDIAKALHVPATYPTKYLGAELGAQASFDVKRDVCIITGAHEPATLTRLVLQFIQEFVLCPSCHLPEINMSVTKDRIAIDCKACGHTGFNTSCHKLVSFIIKSAPKGKHSKENKKKIREEEKKRREKGAKEDKNDIAINKVIKNDSSNDAESVQWHTDTSEKAHLGSDRLEKFQSTEKKTTSILKDSADNSNTAESILRAFINRVSEVKRLKIAKSLNDLAVRLLLVYATIDTDDIKSICKQIKAKAYVYKPFVSDDSQSQKLLISAFEKLIDTVPALLSKTSVMFKALYDEDIIDEDTFLRWYESPPESSYTVSVGKSNEIRTAALQFIDWLKTAEEDED